MQNTCNFQICLIPPAAAISDMTETTQSLLRDESTADGSVIESTITHQNVK